MRRWEVARRRGGLYRDFTGEWLIWQIGSLWFLRPAEWQPTTPEVNASFADPAAWRAFRSSWEAMEAVDELDRQKQRDLRWAAVTGHKGRVA